MSSIGQEVMEDFQWNMVKVVTYLKKSLNHCDYELWEMGLCGGEVTADDIAYDSCIELLAEKGRFNPNYENITIAHGNPLVSYKIKTPDKTIYYVIEIANPSTHQEEVHIFFNDAPVFNLMKCRHIGGFEEPSEDITGVFKDFWVICRNGTKKKETDLKQ